MTPPRPIPPIATEPVPHGNVLPHVDGTSPDLDLPDLDVHPEFRRGLDFAAAVHAQNDADWAEIVADLRAEIKAARAWLETAARIARTEDNA